MSSAGKRVLHVSYALDFGGVETHLRLIAESKQKRFEHHFCALAHSGAAGDAICQAGAQVHVLGKNAWREPVSTVVALRALACRLKATVIHCHGADANLFGLMSGWLAGTPVRIGEEVALRPHKLKARLALKLIYASADRVIAVSDAVAMHLEKLGEVPRSKIVRLYNPVRLSSRRAGPRQSGAKLRIGFVGRLAPEKNPRALVEAMKALKDDCELILIGDGVQHGEIEDLVTSLDLEQHVSLHGYVSDPTAILATCHAYAQPSLHEGMGIALVEAMSCALPAIVTASGGMPEIVEEGVNGWLIDVPTPEAIAASIRKAVSLPAAELAQMGANARQSVESRFDPDRYVQRVEQLYDACLRPQPGRAATAART